MSKLDDHFFIDPSVDINENDSEIVTIVHIPKAQLKERWNTPRGINILTRWKANGYKMDTLDSLIGKYYGHTDIRGIEISGETLRNVDLSYVDLFSSNLSESTFEKCDFTNSWLSETNIEGAKFIWTQMQGVLIDNADFNNKTNFIGINLNDINFTLASLLQELAIGQQKIVHLERRNPFFAKFFRLTCDYGRSFGRFLLCCVSVILVFSLIYCFTPNTVNSYNFLDCLYFSALTFMRMGSTDFHPTSGIGKLIAMAEVSISYIMFGLLVAIFSRRMIVS